MQLQIKKEFKKSFRPRPKNAHKGDFGRLLFVGGSQGLTGSISLSANAAVRSGAGLVTVCVPSSLNPIFEIKLTEPMTFPIDDGGNGFFISKELNKLLSFSLKQDVVGIGPGVGNHPKTQKFVRSLFSKLRKPVLLDADGLNAFCGHLDELKSGPKDVIITPHPGEFDRLFLTKVSQDPLLRRKKALEAAKKYGIIIVLKGHQTLVVTPKGDVFENPTGNPGMASGGMGDVLLGVIAAFIGLRLPLFEAAKFAVYLHGLAADLAVKEFGEISLNATDVIQYLPKAFLKLQR